MKKKIIAFILVLACVIMATGCSIRKIEPLPTADDFNSVASKYSLETTDRSVTGISCIQGKNDTMYAEFYVFDDQSNAVSMYEKISKQVEGYFIDDDKQKTDSDKNGRTSCRIWDSKNAAEVVRKDNVIIYIYVIDAGHIGDEESFIKDLGL